MAQIILESDHWMAYDKNGGNEHHSDCDSPPYNHF